MAGKKFKVHGIECEMWETSFRVDGMSVVLPVGHHCTEDHVRQFVTTVYGAVHDRAVKAGKALLAERAKQLVLEALDA